MEVSDLTLRLNISGFLSKQSSLSNGPGVVPVYPWVLYLSSVPAANLFKQANDILLQELGAPHFLDTVIQYLHFHFLGC